MASLICALYVDRHSAWSKSPGLLSCVQLLSVSQCTVPRPTLGACPCFSWGLIYLFPTAWGPLLIGKNWVSSSLPLFLFSFCVCVHAHMCIVRVSLRPLKDEVPQKPWGSGKNLIQVLLQDRHAAICLPSPRKSWFFLLLA